MNLLEWRKFLLSQKMKSRAPLKARRGRQIKVSRHKWNGYRLMTVVAAIRSSTHLVQHGVESVEDVQKRVLQSIEVELGNAIQVLLVALHEFL